MYPGGGTTGTPRYMTYPDVGFNFNGHQAIVSSGGGAGYGGGGSGAARALSAILVNQKWNGNTAPTGLRQNISYGIQAGAGGAGGSYLASNVIDGAIESSGNGATGAEVHPRISGMGPVCFSGEWSLGVFWPLTENAIE